MGGASADKVLTVHGVKEFQRTTSIVLAEKTKKRVVCKIKVVLVHRNVGADKEGAQQNSGPTVPKVPL